MDTAILKNELAKHHFELVKIIATNAVSIEVSANQLQPADIGQNDPVLVPVPVTLILKLDAAGNISDISGGLPSTGKQITEAVSFVKNLVANNEIADLPGHKANATHRLEENENGSKVLRRKGFSFF